MRESLVLVVVLSGLCFLSPSLTSKYVLVKNAVTWAEAQSDCRNKYIDLASVTNMKDLKLLNQLDQSYNVWIGLYGDNDGWRWSIEDQNANDADTGFRKWAPGQPSGDSRYYNLCTRMAANGDWHDNPCLSQQAFLCYSEDPSNVIFVPTLMNWRDARDYCRSTYTDLAFVKDQAANDQISNITVKSAWIGLYRDSWLWSDGSNVTITNWDTDKPNENGFAACTASLNGKWINSPCQYTWRYVCSRKFTEKKVVKIVVKKSDSSVNIVELQDAILEKVNAILDLQDLNLRAPKRPWLHC